MKKIFIFTCVFLLSINNSNSSPSDLGLKEAFIRMIMPSKMDLRYKMQNISSQDIIYDHNIKEESWHKKNTYPDYKNRHLRSEDGNSLSSLDKKIISNIEYYKINNGKGFPRTKEFIKFKNNSAMFFNESYDILREYGSAIEDGLTSSKLIIEGHTDSIGSPKNNNILSVKRAEAVKSFLVKFYEISPNRLITKGYGESKPIANNMYAKGRALNRRVEFVRIE